MTQFEAIQLALIMFKDRKEYQPREVEVGPGQTKMEQVSHYVFISDMFFFANEILKEAKKWESKE
ncbi:hypothetical protein [Neisseria wadsworthii]|uniref:TetR family transcriptional regulator n=1 Tax=Neisseria wadsworthii 9715 TaxID=1030841 RepID=G4CPH5_9NEIS|nr:hypothetical protein [Neisseria wadsworthii]EGZ47894.1 TetR family transcriptional regulator [Neisseria wadsworthii 9715]QMT34782.1 hypothetical protein H3L96_06740 [Neisseria wadsworthii]